MPLAKKKLIGLIILLPIIQSCTFRGIILNYTDTFLISEIESSLAPTTDKQEKIIEQEVKGFWKKARCTYLQDMKQDFEAISGTLKTGINEQSIEPIKTIMKKWRRTLFTEGVSLLAKLGPSLSPKQISSLKETFAERTDQIKETLNLDPEEYLKERKEKILDNFETFYGQANEQQQTQLFLIYGLNRSRDEIRLENRKYFNDFFISTLTKSKGSDAIKSKFEAWIETPALAIPEAKRPAYLKLMDSWYQKLIATDKLITKQQRQHLVTYLNELKQDLLEQALPASECK